MSENKTPQYSTAETYHTDDGITIANLELTEQKSTENRLEGFLASSLQMLGIEKIAGFKTRRDIGTGEAFLPDGQSIGRVQMWGKGFQPK